MIDLDKYIKELVEFTPIKEQRTIPIYVTKELLERINKQRIQYSNRREAQYKCLERIIKFFEENYGNERGSNGNNGKSN